MVFSCSLLTSGVQAIRKLNKVIGYDVECVYRLRLPEGFVGPIFIGAGHVYRS